jgi:hypothetical protein
MEDKIVETIWVVGFVLWIQIFMGLRHIDKLLQAILHNQNCGR